MTSQVLSFRNPSASLKLGIQAYEGLHYLRAMNHFNRVIQDQPSHFEAHFYKAAILEILGKTQEAIQEFEWLTRIKDDDDELKEFLLNMYFKMENYWKAFQLIKQIVRKHPEDPNWWVHMSDVLFIKKRYRFALTILKSLYRQTERNEHLLFKMMLIYREQNAWDHAIILGNSLVKRVPDNPIYFYFLGTIYLAIQDTPSADHFFKQAYRIIEQNKTKPSELHREIRQKLLQMNNAHPFLA